MRNTGLVFNYGNYTTPVKPEEGVLKIVISADPTFKDVHIEDELVIVIGDDTDITTILKYLRKINTKNVEVFIPNRIKHGVEEKYRGIYADYLK